MATMCQISAEDVFTYADDESEYYVKRGSRVLSSVMEQPGSFGLVGTDSIFENGFTGRQTILESITNGSGQLLRFGLIAKQEARLEEKIADGESIRLVTSYPKTALDMLASMALSSVECISGCVEAEVVERNDIDGALELLQSGASVRQNGLVIVRDNLRPVYLAKVEAGEEINQ